VKGVFLEESEGWLARAKWEKSKERAQANDREEIIARRGNSRGGGCVLNNKSTPKVLFDDPERQSST